MNNKSTKIVLSLIITAYFGIFSFVHAGLVVTNNPPRIAEQKVLLIGGSNMPMLNGVMNDVWSTSDLSHWNMISPDSSSTTKFSRRNLYSFGSNVFFNNKIWVIGGIQGPANGYNLSSEVWSSTNGTAWTLETANPGFAARSTAPVVFQNKLWVIGGVSNTSTDFGDIWNSVDGRNWTRVATAEPFGTRSNMNPIVFNNKLWIIGGWSPNGTNVNDVWNSSDGITWVQVTPHAAFPVRHGADVIVFNNKMWIMAGLGNGSMNDLSDVWSSSDGATWTQNVASAPWGGRYASNALAVNGRIFILGGFSDAVGMKNDVWSSADGATWTQVAQATLYTARELAEIVVVP